MMNVFLFLVGIGMLVLVVMVILPKDLSAIQGYPIDPMKNGAPRNLLDEVQNVMISRNSEVAFTETEINQYLNQRMQGEQSGAMGALVAFKGVYADLFEGGFELIVERELFGLPITVTRRFRAEEFRHQMRYVPSGFTVGRISLGSRSIKPVVDMFGRMQSTCQEEIFTIKQMARVRYEDNRVVFDASI
tara:strand:- start:1707 stop:2273 length:567 start_codon:yes stop_codon:yes gene_type:complete